MNETSFSLNDSTNLMQNEVSTVFRSPVFAVDRLKPLTSSIAKIFLYRRVESTVRHYVTVYILAFGLPVVTGCIT